MKKNILSYVFVALAAISGLPSCIKDDTPAVGSAGTPRVKILEATRRSLFYSPFTDVQTVDLFSIRRDETSPAGIDQAITVKVLAVPDSVQAYNDANGTSYEPLPDSLYSLADNGVTRDGDNFSIPVASKSIGSELTIKLDGAKWDVTHKYGMWYKIVDPAGLTIANDAGYVFVTIEAKNQWDGVYEVTGSYTDVTNPAFVAIYPLTWELQTKSPTECIVVDNVLLGIPGYVFSTNGDPADESAWSYYGNFGLVVKFDPATNQIVDMYNYYGQPASNTRSAVLDPTGENAYNPDSKTISIKYFMTQPSVVTTPPYIRAKFQEQWKYTGPRE